MRLKDILLEILEKDSYEVFLVARWLAEKKISCMECIKTRAMISKIPPDCSGCLPIKPQLKKYFPEKKEIQKDETQHKETNRNKSNNTPQVS